jgi:cytochrome c oxidase subunit 3
MAERSQARPPWLGRHYDTIEQQEESAHLGMWVFLMTEVMLFGGLFLAYTTYRLVYPEGWAEGSHHLELVLGTVNTAVLLISSLTMALAVRSVKLDERGWLVAWLGATAVLGVLFLGFKALEYSHHYADHLAPGFGFQYEGPSASAVELFFFLYFTMTGLHAIHLTIGVLIVVVALAMARSGSFTSGHSAPIEVIGLYWHFVDVVWVFLLPLFYLIGVSA